MASSEPSWLQVPSSSTTSAESLAKDVATLRAKRIEQGTYTASEEEGVCRAQPLLTEQPLSLSPELQERLRLLCQLWEVDIVQTKITSHRAFIGPVIVAIKKALYPLLKFLLKDMVRQQRDFNAATIRYLAELSNKELSKNRSQI